MRRALFLLLLASVLMTEPTQARAALAPEQVGLPPTTARWIHQLAIAIRQTVKPAATLPPAWHRFRPTTAILTTTEPQVASIHPATEPHAFRLPPPR